TFVRPLPLAVAILDRQMNYLAVSDRWITDYKIKTVNIIGQNHYEVFPETPRRWRENHQDCLMGKIDSLSQSEDFFVRESGLVDWLQWQLNSWRNLDGQIGGLLIFSEVITDRKLLQQKIQSTEGQMRAIFSGMPEFVFTVEPNSDSILILPTKFFELYDDTTIDSIICQTQNLLFDGPESRASQALIRRVLRQQRAIEFEYSLLLEDTLIWFSVSIFPVSESTVIWIAKDVTNRKEIEQNTLYAEKELAQITLQSIGDGVITTDADGRVQYLNPVAEQITGWSLSESTGKPLKEIFQLISGKTKKPIVNPIARVSRNHKVCKLAAKNSLLNRQGIYYEVEGLASPIMNRQSKLIGTAIVFRDVTAARKMARKLSWQATHDPLTELYNRRKFEDYTAEAIADAHHHDSCHALCYLDLDRFKIVNDTCGHAAGDKLLQQVTTLLRKRIRHADIFARLGGDEFGILFHHCPIEVARDCANELRKLIEDFRFIWQEKVFRIGVSIGLVEIKSTTEDLASLLTAVDAACYEAKQQGGNYVHLCHEQDLSVARQKGERQWVEKINRALEENSFRLYVQKIVSIESAYPIDLADTVSSGTIHHHEILLRLQDEAGNIIAPGAFLPAAERYGLMPAIDRWVISTFLAGYEAYCQSCTPPTSAFYTINLSGASINNQEFGNFLRQQFDLYQVPPQTICFEITETVAITNLENANILIGQLKDLGCSIALDDFGSGMSSLTYLKNLPIDYLKIDGSFVTNIANDRVDYATVECFNHISQIMNIKTIAEFVENQTILQNLQQIGIDYAQGYGIERPKPLIWSTE
ncbi:MAG: EAL domain-containing protein, partial [Cyanobacteria bacterium J06623_7]